MVVSSFTNWASFTERLGVPEPDEVPEELEPVDDPDEVPDEAPELEELEPELGVPDEAPLWLFAFSPVFFLTSQTL